jgi:hypothetical protein
MRSPPRLRLEAQAACLAVQQGDIAARNQILAGIGVPAELANEGCGLGAAEG